MLNNIHNQKRVENLVRELNRSGYRLNGKTISIYSIAYDKNLFAFIIKIDRISENEQINFRAQYPTIGVVSSKSYTELFIT